MSLAVFVVLSTSVDQKLPGFLERMRGRLKSHREQGHQPWPARGRHVRRTEDGHAQRRLEAFDSDVHYLSPSEQITRRDHVSDS